MFQHVSTISTSLEWFADFWCFLKRCIKLCMGTVWINLKNCLPPNLEVLVPFLPARHDASKMPKVVVLKVAVALPSPTCPEGVLPRYHWVNWSGPKSTKWMMGNCTTPLHPKKKGGTHESPMITRHISIRLSSYTKIPKNISVPEGWSWGWRFGVYQ